MSKHLIKQKGTYPILPLTDTIVFPSTSTYLIVGREKCIASVEEAQRRDGNIIVVGRKDSSVDKNDKLNLQADDLYTVGTLCQINNIAGTQETGYRILVTGIVQVKIDNIDLSNDYYLGTGVNFYKHHEVKAQMDPLFNKIKRLIIELTKLLPELGRYSSKHIEKISNSEKLVYLAISYLKLKIHQSQQILEEPSILEMMKSVHNHLKREIEVIILEEDIKDKVSHKLTKLQKNALLTEQLNVIKEELGEEQIDKTSEYNEKLFKAKLPSSTNDIIAQEIKRLSKFNENSPEYFQKLKYLDDFFELPWSTSDPTEIDIDESEAILNEHHFNLEKIKKRIIEHIAVVKLKGNLKGTILCFVGPPGVGKTSLGKSIAKALGRKFIRISLGGINDEASIRGHRQTYTGSMPGKIIQEIKRVGVNNPVIMFDEIDKINTTYGRGVSSAMLEVLDPEQNSSFHDHYLNVPFDLSKVFFLCTANLADAIPTPLRDRMEIIQLSSYTLNEKIKIGEQFIIPKALLDSGIKSEQVAFEEGLLKNLIKDYTKDSGVREINRLVLTICRGVAYKILKGEKIPIIVNDTTLYDYLGPQRFIETQELRRWAPGIATGLAWTSIGGEIIYIECLRIPGDGNLKITGQLGNVMKESVELAYSYILSNRHKLNTKFDFKKNDIHLHIPSGSTPKDGPSAGITILCALISLVTNRVIDKKIAMTGEVTLSGSILAVGGIREKIIAASKYRMIEVILPKQNIQDLYDLPRELVGNIHFKLFESVEEVISEVFNINITNDYEPIYEGEIDEHHKYSSEKGLHSKH